MDKYLVTGGSGFIGTNLMEALLKEGVDVINVDAKEPLNKYHTKYFRRIDIRILSELKRCVEDFKPDYIIHLAARCDLNGKTIKDYDTNTVGVENIISVSKNCATLKKLLITSSMLVCHPGYVPCDEQDYMPTTVYGESKILTEKITRESNLQCDWAILRPTSIWGPWFDVPYKNFFEMIWKGHYIHIAGNKASMTYGYVKNVVVQILGILHADTSVGAKVFYLGDYVPTSIEEWADEIAEEFGKRIIVVPRFVINCGALLGDFLKKIGVCFPLTTFRLKNMTTNSILNLTETKKIVQELPFDRIQGVKETVKWMYGCTEEK